MKRPLTASMLYNLVHCPHRLALDIHGDPAERDEVSRFVKLLWEKGNVFEEETIERLDEDFTDLSGAEAGDVEALTSEASTGGGSAPATFWAHPIYCGATGRATWPATSRAGWAPTAAAT